MIGGDTGHVTPVLTSDWSRLVSSMLPGPVLAAALHLFGWWQYSYSSRKMKSQ